MTNHIDETAQIDGAAEDRVRLWIAELEARQLADLTFSEVARALRALSSTYVERRAKLKEGAALSGAGKRAAFALYYAPLHYLLVGHVVSALGRPFTEVDRLLDLGCGTGASGAGWAAACPRPPRLAGIDRNPWAVEEARRTWSALGINGTVRVGDIKRDIASRPAQSRAEVRNTGSGRAGVLLAFTLNEIAVDTERDALLDLLLQRVALGEHVLIVEPLARAVAPWWGSWQRAFESRGGRVDEWRITPPVPAIVEKLGRAAGLDYREVKGRTIAL